MRRRAITSILALLLAPGLGLAGDDAAPRRAEDLPGYYEFFMKSGRQVRIKAEEARDTKIEAGALKPEALNEALPDLRLPRSSGAALALRSFKGKKNLVVVSFRSWW